MSQPEPSSEVLDLRRRLAEAEQENGQWQQKLAEVWKEVRHLRAMPEPGATALTLAHDQIGHLQAEIRLRDEAMKESLRLIHASHPREPGCMPGCGPIHAVLLGRQQI